MTDTDSTYLCASSASFGSFEQKVCNLQNYQIECLVILKVSLNLVDTWSENEEEDDDGDEPNAPDLKAMFVEEINDDIQTPEVYMKHDNLKQIQTNVIVIQHKDCYHQNNSIVNTLSVLDPSNTPLIASNISNIGDDIYLNENININ